MEQLARRKYIYFFYSEVAIGNQNKQRRNTKLIQLIRRLRLQLLVKLLKTFTAAVVLNYFDLISIPSSPSILLVMKTVFFQFRRLKKLLTLTREPNFGQFNSTVFIEHSIFKSVEIAMSSNDDTWKKALIGATIVAGVAALYFFYMRGEKQSNKGCTYQRSTRKCYLD